MDTIHITRSKALEYAKDIDDIYRGYKADASSAEGLTEKYGDSFEKIASAIGRIIDLKNILQEELNKTDGLYIKVPVEYTDEINCLEKTKDALNLAVIKSIPFSNVLGGIEIKPNGNVALNLIQVAVIMSSAKRVLKVHAEHFNDGPAIECIEALENLNDYLAINIGMGQNPIVVPVHHYMALNAILKVIEYTMTYKAGGK